jgi:SPP1 gp7 family putative phage head morphogenesis protein
MPTIYDAVGEFQERLLRNERRAAAQMVRVYADSWKRIKARLAVLQKEYERTQAQGQDVGLAWLYQKQRLTAMQALVAKELAHFSAFSQRTISSQQARAIAESLAFNRDMTILAMGAEYDEQSRFVVNNLNKGETEALIGATQRGSALDKLFRSICEAGAQSAEDALVQGMVMGYNPRKIAPMIRDALGIQLNRALTISRTEALRAQRIATAESYKANADVIKGWRWQAALTGNTCPVCLSLHGSEHPITEVQKGHINCRCTSVAITKSWEELGAEYGVDFSGVEKAGPSFADVAKKYGITPEQLRTYANRKLSGEAYFRSLSAEEQRAILGPSKWLAWKDGKFGFDALSRKTYSAVWGEGVRQASLVELLGEAEAKRYMAMAKLADSLQK